MEYFYEKELKNEYKKQIFDLLCKSDNEFIPPLSSRKDTKQKNFGVDLVQNVLPYSYYEKVILQSNLIAVEDGNILGFYVF